MHTSASTSNMRVDAAVRARAAALKLMNSEGADYTVGILSTILAVALADMSKSKAIVRLEQLEEMVDIKLAEQKA